VSRFALVLALLAVAFAPSAAWSQTPPYPGPTSTAPPTNTQAEQNGGVLATGARRTVESCGFAPGGRVAVSFAGQSAGSDLVEVDGCARTTVEVLGAASTRGSCRVRVNDQLFTVAGGNAELRLTGPGTNGAERTVTTRFEVSCTGAAGSGLPRTGQNIAAWAAIGLLSVVVGALLVRATRAGRRRRSIISI
jgi:hypothetical protein